jgi:hypothetical protein
VAFTEWYCESGGSNLNGGSNAGAVKLTFTNGGYNATTHVFTATGADLSVIAVGDFASVYLDGASAPTAFIGRVTAVDDTLDLITLGAARIGTEPGTAASGVTIKVGGAWLGPTGASGFPFNFMTNAAVNAAADTVRVNFKNDATYSITAAITISNNGLFRWEGYTTTVGDGGRAIIDGGATGTSFTLLNANGGDSEFKALIFQNNGDTGTSDGVVTGSAVTRIVFYNCVFHNLRGSGLSFGNSGGQTAVECEAYLCNGSNAASKGGFNTSVSSVYVRCVSHDNAGSNGIGFRVSIGANNSMTTFERCISDTNGSDGFNVGGGSTSSVLMMNCESYNNTGDGIDMSNTASMAAQIINCNLVKNGGWGINGSGSGTRAGEVTNCGFGAGTQANTSGTTTGLKSMVESGSVTYAADVTPWLDPANGDFRINLAAAKGAGRGAFTQTQASYTGAVGYPDIGAAQSIGPAGNIVGARSIGTY